MSRVPVPAAVFRNPPPKRYIASASTFLGLMKIEVPPDRIEAFRRKWKIRRLTFFGSVLRDDFRPDSDVDVLVEFEPDAGHSLFDLVAMDEEAAEIFGHKADLVELENVRNPFIRHGILHPRDTPLRPEERDAAYLWEMRRAATEAWEHGGGRTREEITAGKILPYALASVLERLGHFAAKVSAGLQAAHPEIPWGRLVALADGLAGGDAGAERIWAALQTDLSELAEKLDRLVPPLPGEPGGSNQPEMDAGIS